MLCYSWHSLLAQSLHPVPSTHVLSYVNSHLGHEEWKEEKKGGRKTWSQETGNVTRAVRFYLPTQNGGAYSNLSQPGPGILEAKPVVHTFLPVRMGFSFPDSSLSSSQAPRLCANILRAGTMPANGKMPLGTTS